MSKSELQKMLDGELYNPFVPELTEMRNHARRTVVKFNTIPFDNEEDQYTLLKGFLGSIGSKLSIQAPFYCDYGFNIHVGENFYMNFNGIILDSAKVTIGSNVLIGPNVQLLTAYHPIDAAERIKGPELGSPITIGDNVWLAGGVIICQGVTIGDNTTIGAGSVVTRSIPANVLAVGNPCRVIREIKK